MTDPQLPERIGRYRIRRLLGSGAMGDVYLAEDPHIDRELAIKTVRVLGANEEDVADRKERLLREAKAAGKLIHPNVVTLFDADEVDGTLYLAFEYVPGTDLAERARSAEPISLAETLRWTREIASALDFAHGREIVHRDIKPSNILISTDGAAKVADFGIAKLLGQNTELTRTGSVVGSPQYMSPEQVRGEDLDGRSDIFSLGVVLYEMLCGIRPFGGETLSTLVYEILSKEPPPVGSLRPSLPGRLVSLAHRMLAKDRRHRAADAGEVADEIRAIEAELSQERLAAPAAPRNVEETRRIAKTLSAEVAASSAEGAGAEGTGTGPEDATRVASAVAGAPPPPPPAAPTARADEAEPAPPPAPPSPATQSPATASPAPPATPPATSGSVPPRDAPSAAASSGPPWGKILLGLGVLALVAAIGLFFVARALLPGVLARFVPEEETVPTAVEEVAVVPEDEPEEAEEAETGPADETSPADVEPVSDDEEPPPGPTAEPSAQPTPSATTTAEAESEPPAPSAPPTTTFDAEGTEPELDNRAPPARPPTNPVPPPPREAEASAQPEPLTEPEGQPVPEAEAEPPPPPPPAEPEVDPELERWQQAASAATEERSTGMRLRFDVEADDAFVIVRVWPKGDRMIVKGQAEDFRDGRKGRDMELPNPGDHLVQLLINGNVRHSVLVHAASRGGEADVIRARLGR